MSTSSVTIADGKKGFSQLVDRASRDKEDVVITKRGKPVAVIVPYEHYQQTRRIEALSKIVGAREVLRKSGLSADEIVQAQRAERDQRR